MASSPLCDRSRSALSSRGLAALAAVLLAPGSVCAAERLPFSVETQVAHRELNPGFCWFHPRVAALYNTSYVPNNFGDPEPKPRVNFR